MKRIEFDEGLLRQLFSAGVPLVKIAERFGCGRHGVRRAVDRLGLTRSPGHRPEVPHVRKIDEDVVRRLFNEGAPLDAIARRFGCSHGPVRRVVRKLGLTRIRLPNRMCCEAHPNWSGGRTIDGSGYVRIKVGRKHPEADCRSYAREHRLVMSAILGRPLARNEVVHHLNHNRQDNRPENLVVMTATEHSRHHGKTMPAEERKRRAATALANFEGYHRRGSAITRRMVACRCGCGTLIETPNRWGAKRRFAPGHGRRGLSERASRCAA